MRFTYYKIEVDETNKTTSVEELVKILKKHHISARVEKGNSVNVDPLPSGMWG